MPLISIAFALASLAAQDSDAKALFAWYDSLNLSEEIKKPFVEFSTTGFGRHSRYGFVVEDGAKKVKILTTDLAFVELGKEGESYRPFILRNIQPANIKDALKAYAEFTLADRNTRTYNDSILRCTSSTAAWLCKKFGLDEESERLMNYDKQWHEEVIRNNGGTDRSGLGYVGRAKMYAMGPIEHEAVLEIENNALTWADLQHRFEALADRYRDCPQSAEFAELIDRMKKLDEDAKNHVAKDATEEDKIRELVWSLPYVNNDRPVYNSTTAGEIVRKGLAAVPVLIEALDDDRLTHSVWDGDGPPMNNSLRTIYRVKDVVDHVLYQIAHRTFLGRTPADRKAEVEKWYRSVQTGGEASAIVATVRKGGSDAVAGARALVKNYPDVALAAIMDGYQVSDESNRRGLVEELDNLKGQDVEDFLFLVAETDKGFDPRAAALEILVDRSKDRALPMAIKEWQQFKSDGFSFGLPKLVSTLVESNRVDAVRALAKNLRKRPVTVRFSVVSGAQNTSMRHMMRNHDYSKSTMNEDVKLAVEDLLASELDDDEVWNGMMGVGDIRFESPKMSTIANFELSRFLPGIYSFTNTSSTVELASQRAEALKTYRRRVKARDK